MAKKRKPRTKIDESVVDKLKPLDLLSLGTDKDPCFGKHHSLKAPECLSCGDSEFCSIVTAQNMHKKRLEVEGEQEMKDLDEAEGIQIKKVKGAQEMMNKLKSVEHKKMKVILKVAEKFNLTKAKAKELYNQTI